MFIGDSGVASMTLVGVVEEAGQSLRQHLMVVVARDEAVLGALDTFAAEQGAGREAAEDLDNGIVCEDGQGVPLVGGLLHFVYVQQDESLLSNEMTKEENNPTEIQQ